MELRLTVNGTAYESEVESRTLLVHHLRDALGLTGTKVGCDTSSCGACTVLFDGRAVKSCTILAVQADDVSITTIEGLADASAVHPLQEAFKAHHALQCGYCTPGMLMAATSLLAEQAHLDERTVRRDLEGNLCRCTGYRGIVDAILDVARLA